MAARTREAELRRFIKEALQVAGADEESAGAVERALLHASLLGVDSHGLRLLPHYLKVLGTGRINPRPRIAIESRAAATARLDGDNGFGHLAGYRAMAEATRLAETQGLGAVAVINSSHYGAAGTYALWAAERGFIGLSVCNSDAIVQLHEGREAFHGTNPLAFAAPLAEPPHYLIDMATSAIPWNRVLAYRAAGQGLPDKVAVDGEGRVTREAEVARSLKPLGGDYSYKGAALAGMVEVLSSALTGMAFSQNLLSMNGPDFETPRRLGQFFLALKPEAFLERADYERTMADYLAALRAAPPAEGGKVMAPGDREWTVKAERLADGIPLDRPNVEAYAAIADELGIAPLALT